MDFWLCLFFPDNDIPTQLSVCLQFTKDSSHFIIVWGTLKAFLMGLLRGEVIKIKCFSQQWEQELLFTVENMKRDYILIPNLTTQSLWQGAQ